MGPGSVIRKNAGSGSALNHADLQPCPWCPVPVPTQLANELFGLEPPELEDPLGVAGDNLLIESIRGYPSQAILQNIINLLNMRKVQLYKSIPTKYRKSKDVLEKLN